MKARCEGRHVYPTFEGAARDARMRHFVVYPCELVEGDHFHTRKQTETLAESIVTAKRNETYRSAGVELAIGQSDQPQRISYMKRGRKKHGS